MPGFDGTGPQGAGSMTGVAKGFCNPAASGYTRGAGRGRSFGRGFSHGMGMGGGFGRGFRWYPPEYGSLYPAQSVDEMDMLKAHADQMQTSLDAINKRIVELEKNASG